ncbi:MAG: radical SAM protein [Desulfurococcales archaeon]|nr:radical SAM protein [Desulfurococcales archaeon]
MGELPKGCKLCMEGLKSVLFVTGLCSERCFYCPISPGRRGRDVVFINDVRVSDIEKDVVCEVVASGSKGVGITGGDPLIRLDRTIKIIKNLKDFFGSSFHIHLYTAGTLLKDEAMSKLVNAGLDEIRIHVINDGSWRAVKLAVDYPVSVGIENPVIPGSMTELKNLILKAYSIGVGFVNLNELEFSEGNYVNLRLRGIRTFLEVASTFTCIQQAPYLKMRR